jgi:hypothetical protein
VSNSKQALRNAFANMLMKALRERYRELPSASFIAKEFNLRTDHDSFITQETARRWTRGLAIPEFYKLLILRSWLDIDLNGLATYRIPISANSSLGLEGDSLTKQEQYNHATESIKTKLHELSIEFERLEKNLALKKTLIRKDS